MKEQPIQTGDAPSLLIKRTEIRTSFNGTFIMGTGGRATRENCGDCKKPKSHSDFRYAVAILAFTLTAGYLYYEDNDFIACVSGAGLATLLVTQYNRVVNWIILLFSLSFLVGALLGVISFIQQWLEK